MRIAFLVTSYPALSATFIQNQISGLVTRGHEVHIFGDRPGDTDRMHEDVERLDLLARTTSAPMPHGGLARLLHAPLPFTRLLATRPRAALQSLAPRYGRLGRNLVLLYSSTSFTPPRSFDVVHAHFGPNGVKGQFLRDVGLLQGPLLTSWYGYDLTRTVKEGQAFMYRDLFARGDRQIPLCRYFQDRLVEQGCARERTTVHHIGVDTDRFAFRPRTVPKDRAVRLFSIARLVEKKGVAYAIQAVARLRDAGHRVQYGIAGDGELRSDLEALIRDHNLEDVVTLHGWMRNEEVAEHLDRADLFLAPSVTAADGDQEGTPTVIMEASARGLPIVATHHSGIPEIIDDGQTGALVPERDVDALTTALRELLEAPHRWGEMGAAGTAKIGREFNTERLQDDLVTIYESVRADAASRSY